MRGRQLHQPSSTQRRFHLNNRQPASTTQHGFLHKSRSPQSQFNHAVNGNKFAATGMTIRTFKVPAMEDANVGKLKSCEQRSKDQQQQLMNLESNLTSGLTSEEFREVANIVSYIDQIETEKDIADENDETQNNTHEESFKTFDKTNNKVDIEERELVHLQSGILIENRHLSMMMEPRLTSQGPTSQSRKSEMNKDLAQLQSGEDGEELATLEEAASPTLLSQKYQSTGSHNRISAKQNQDSSNLIIPIPVQTQLHEASSITASLKRRKMNMRESSQIETLNRVSPFIPEDEQLAQVASVALENKPREEAPQAKYLFLSKQNSSAYFLNHPRGRQLHSSSVLPSLRSSSKTKQFNTLAQKHNSTLSTTRNDQLIPQKLPQLQISSKTSLSQIQTTQLHQEQQQLHGKKDNQVTDYSDSIVQVDARVSTDHMPTAVQMQKSQIARNQLLKKMTEGWSSDQKLRIKATRGRIIKGTTINSLKGQEKPNQSKDENKVAQRAESQLEDHERNKAAGEAAVEDTFTLGDENSVGENLLNEKELIVIEEGGEHIISEMESTLMQNMKLRQTSKDLMKSFTNVHLTEDSQQALSALQASRLSLDGDNDSLNEIEKINLQPKIGESNMVAAKNTVYLFQVGSTSIDYKLPQKQTTKVQKHKKQQNSKVERYESQVNSTKNQQTSIKNGGSIQLVETEIENILPRSIDTRLLSELPQLNSDAVDISDKVQSTDGKKQHKALGKPVTPNLALLTELTMQSRDQMSATDKSELHSPLYPVMHEQPTKVLQGQEDDSDKQLSLGRLSNEQLNNQVETGQPVSNLNTQNNLNQSTHTKSLHDTQTDQQQELQRLNQSHETPASFFKISTYMHANLLENKKKALRQHQRRSMQLSQFELASLSLEGTRFLPGTNINTQQHAVGSEEMEPITNLASPVVGGNLEERDMEPPQVTSSQPGTAEKIETKTPIFSVTMDSLNSSHAQIRKPAMNKKQRKSQRKVSNKTNKYLYATMQDQSPKKGSERTKQKNQSKAMRASVYSTSKSPKRSNYDGVSTRAGGVPASVYQQAREHPQSRGNNLQANSDLSELDKSLVKSRTVKNQLRSKRTTRVDQPGQVSISIVKHSRENSQAKALRLKQGKKRQKSATSSLPDLNSTLVPGGTDKNISFNLSKQSQNENCEQNNSMILVQTDHQGLISFQDKANPSRLDHAVVDRLNQEYASGDGIIEEPAYNNSRDVSSDSTAMQQFNQGHNPPEQTFYCDIGSEIGKGEATGPVDGSDAGIQRSDLFEQRYDEQNMFSDKLRKQSITTQMKVELSSQQRPHVEADPDAQTFQMHKTTNFATNVRQKGRHQNNKSVAITGYHSSMANTINSQTLELVLAPNDYDHFQTQNQSLQQSQNARSTAKNKKQMSINAQNPRPGPRATQSVSPLQRRTKEQQRKLISSVDDPNSQLRNAPEGVIANRVRQSLEFKQSLHSYDYQREKQLFGKTVTSDLVFKSTGHEHTSSQNSLRASKAIVTNVSKLEPQSSLASYQGALGLNPEKAARDEEMLLLYNQVSECTPMQVLLRKASTEQILKEANFEPLSLRQRKFLDKEKVDINRVRTDRFNHMLETQYKKQALSLERSQQNQVRDHQKNTLRNNSTIPVIVSSKQTTQVASKFQPDDSLRLNHKQRQVLDRLKMPLEKSIQNAPLLLQRKESKSRMNEISKQAILEHFISQELEHHSTPDLSSTIVVDQQQQQSLQLQQNHPSTRHLVGEDLNNQNYSTASYMQEFFPRGDSQQSQKYLPAIGLGQSHHSLGWPINNNNSNGVMNKNENQQWQTIPAPEQKFMSASRMDSSEIDTQTQHALCSVMKNSDSNDRQPSQLKPKILRCGSTETVLLEQTNVTPLGALRFASSLEDQQHFKSTQQIRDEHNQPQMGKIYQQLVRERQGKHGLLMQSKSAVRDSSLSVLKKKLTKAQQAEAIYLSNGSKPIKKTQAFQLQNSHSGLLHKGRVSMAQLLQSNDFNKGQQDSTNEKEKGIQGIQSQAVLIQSHQKSITAQLHLKGVSAARSNSNLSKSKKTTVFDYGQHSRIQIGFFKDQKLKQQLELTRQNSGVNNIHMGNVGVNNITSSKGTAVAQDQRPAYTATTNNDLITHTPQ